jgi:glycosyltransferase involved in cell wall biosynthesis
MRVRASNPLVSVVMATFNDERYVPLAIESVLGQTFHDFEFIIVDDGSTDNSHALLSEYCRRDSRIRLLSQDHSGLVAALNAGCHLASGSYIARLDSDDIAKPWRFEEQLRYLRHQPTALLGGAIECIDHGGTVSRSIVFPTQSDGLMDYLMVNNYMSHTTVMFKKEAFLEVGCYRSEFESAEDYDLFLRISERYAIDNLRVVLCEYRVHSDQTSFQRASQQIVSSIGARFAAWARRSGCAEPRWRSGVASRSDLISCGMRSEKIDELILRHREKGVMALSSWSSASEQTT